MSIRKVSSKALSSITLAISLSLIFSGCAYHQNVTPIRITEDSLANPSIQPSFGMFTANKVEGSVGVGYNPYRNPFSLVAGAVAGGVITGNSNTGIMLASASGGGQSTSPFGGGVVVDIPKIYLQEILNNKGIIVNNPKAVPNQGVVLRPEVILAYDDIGRVGLTCILFAEKYETGSQDWKFYYSSQKSYLWDEISSKNIDPSIFHSEVKKCLQTVNNIFRAHVNGKLDNSFKKGVLMQSSDAGFNGMFYKDNTKQIYLRYTTTFIEAFPVAKAFSFQYKD